MKLLTILFTFMASLSLWACESYKVSALNQETVSHGTAFALNFEGRNYLLTADHVLGANPRKILIDGEFETKVVKRSWSHDLAILEIPEETPLSEICQLSTTSLESNEEVILRGYPSQGQNLLNNQGIVLSPSSDQVKVVKISNGLSIAGHTVAGMSGGPILNLEGKIVGVILQKLVKSEEQSEVTALGHNIESLTTAMKQLTTRSHPDLPFIRNRVDKTMTFKGLTVEWKLASTHRQTRAGDPFDQTGDNKRSLKIINILPNELPRQWKELGVIWKNRPIGSSLYIDKTNNGTRVDDTIDFAKTLLNESLPYFDLRIKFSHQAQESGGTFQETLTRQMMLLSVLSDTQPEIDGLERMGQQLLREIVSLENQEEIPVLAVRAYHHSVGNKLSIIQDALTNDATYEIALEVITIHYRLEHQYRWLKK